MSAKEDLLKEDQVIEKLKRFAAKVGVWTFSNHPYQLQAEEAAVILKMLETKNNDTKESPKS